MSVPSIQIIGYLLFLPYFEKWVLHVKISFIEIIGLQKIFKYCWKVYEEKKDRSLDNGSQEYLTNHLIGHLCDVFQIANEEEKENLERKGIQLLTGFILKQNILFKLIKKTNRFQISL